MRPRNVLLLAGIAIAGIAASYGAVVVGWPWYQDLVLPREVKPLAGSYSWSLPAGTVPTGETEPPLARREAAELLENPNPATPASIATGKEMFATYCVLCHGNDGHGDGPVSEKFFEPPDLPSIMGRRTDGYLYATIRNGGVVMPPHGYRIPPSERWDLVNYLRSIQE